MLATVFDLDDLCDDFDPWDELHALKKRHPNLKVTLFAIPYRCSDELLARYRALDWVELGVHGYHHSSYECAVWGYEETIARLTEIEEWWTGARLFKAPGWVGNKELYRALEDLGWLVATHKDHEIDWNVCAAKMYTYNKRSDIVPIHGHTWDCLDNGPSNWDTMFEKATEEFRFVSDVCRSTSYLEELDLELKPGDLFVDIGAFIGEEIQSCVDRGVLIESYEPHPEWYARLEKRWEGCDLVTLHNCAVADKGGEAQLLQPALGEYQSGSSLYKMILRSEQVDIGTVRVMDAADAVRDRDIAVLKIDAEGAEWDILGRIHETVGFSRIGKIYVEDHVEKLWNAPEWMEKRAKVQADLEAAGVEVLPWI